MADLVIRAHNRAFEEAPDAFYGVGVDIAAHGFLSTVPDGEDGAARVSP